MRVYLDVCCLNRPFDDQRQSRVRMEAEAVALVYDMIDAGQIEQVSSQMAEIEIAAIRDVERRRRIRALLPAAKGRIRLNQKIFRRAEILIDLGFSTADSTHLAAAEASKADVFLTCDDQILRLGRRHEESLYVLVRNPLQWIQESQDASISG